MGKRGRPGVSGKKGKAKSPKPKTERALVSIVIPTIRQTEMVRDCVEAIQKNTRGLPHEVIVVDDGSAEDVQTYLRDLAEEFGLRLVLKTENEGFSRACNDGIRQAKGRDVVLMNNDVLVHEGWLRELVRVSEKEPNVGVVGARLLYADGRIQHAGIMFDARVETAFEHRHRFANANQFQLLQQRDEFAVTFALALLTRDAIDTVGLLDEDLFVSLEDVDYCLSVRQAGMRVIYCPRCVATHLEGATRGKRFFQMDPYWVKRQVETLDTFFAKWAESGISSQVPELAGFEAFCHGWLAPTDPIQGG